MTQNHSDWVRDLFAAAARDSTPAAARHAACVLYVPISRDPEASRRCSFVLSDAELQRAERFVTESGKAHFKQRRAFRRFCAALVLGSSRPLSQIIFNETEKGRPYVPALPDFWFSFSSCRSGFLGAWSSNYGIGVDIEDRTKNVESAELAEQFFSESEAKAVDAASGLVRQQMFLQLWTLKEAALKSIGEGLPFGLDTFQFELAPELCVVHAPFEYGGPERFSAHVIEGTDSYSALVMRSTI